MRPSDGRLSVPTFGASVYMCTGYKASAEGEICPPSIEVVISFLHLLFPSPSFFFLLSFYPSAFLFCTFVAPVGWHNSSYYNQ
jgi:hypothetical protein